MFPAVSPAAAPCWGTATAAKSASCLQEQQCLMSQRTYQQLCWVTVLVLTKKKRWLHRLFHWRLWQRGWLWLNTGFCLLRDRKWNLPNKTAAHSRPRWRTNPLSTTDPHFNRRPAPLHPAERALATHVEVTEGKYTQEKGHWLGFTPRARRAGGLCACLGFWLGRSVRSETKARKKRLSRHLAHVSDQRCSSLVEGLNEPVL